MVEFDVLMSALFSLVLIISLDVIGIKIALKYRVNKNRTFLLMGMTWIGLSELWVSSFITVFLVVLDPTSTGLTPELFVILSFLLLPLTCIFYITAATDLILNKYQRILQIMVIIYCIFFDFVLFYFIFTGNTSAIFIMHTYYDVEYTFITFSLLMPILATFVIFGYLIAFEAIRSKDKDVTLKGKLLLLAFTMFAIGTALDALTINPLIDFFDRIFIIASAFFFYCGYILPKWIKKIFRLDR